MRDYQPMKSKYWMENTRFRRALAIARDYERLRAARQEILYGSPAPADRTGAPKGVPSDPTAQRALRLARVEEELRRIEEALAVVPRDVRGAVLENINSRGQKPARFLAGKYHCDAATIQRWRQRYLWEIAERMIP